MSPEFLQRAVRVPAAANPDQATAQTILIMCRDHIWPSVHDPIVQFAASSVADEALGEQRRSFPEPFTTRSGFARSAWAYAKRNIRFIHHSKLIRDWFREVDHLQLLIQPSVLLRFPETKWPMVGDCAIYSCLIAAMLAVYEIPWRLVTLACDPRQPAIFSHVFPRAQMEDGSWFTLDASHGKYPGWQVPAEHTFREQSWNTQGAPVQ